MKSKYTHLVVLIDRSGSMLGLKKDVIGGFNTLIEEQKKEPGELSVTLVQFDTADPFEVLNDMSLLKEVKLLTEQNYNPRGGTPLNDSLGKLINHTGTKLSEMDENNRPEKVIFAVITDGEENSSHEFSTSKIKEMIKHQEEKYQWKFIYLGANQDSFAEGGARGMGNAMNFAATSKGTSAMYASLTSNVSSMRGMSNTAYAAMDSATLNNSLKTDYDKALNEEEKKKKDLFKNKETADSN